MKQPFLERLAKENGASLYHDADHDVTMFIFSPIDGIVPLLITADGDTWCPDATKVNQRVRLWERNMNLTGVRLIQEVKDMFSIMKLGSPNKMLRVCYAINKNAEAKKLS